MAGFDFRLYFLLLVPFVTKGKEATESEGRAILAFVLDDAAEDTMPGLLLERRELSLCRRRASIDRGIKSFAVGETEGESVIVIFRGR